MRVPFRAGWIGALGAVATAGCTKDSLDLSHPALVDFGDGRDGALTATGAESVNLCRLVTGVVGNRVETAYHPFEVGGRVLLWQTQDAFATSGDPSVVTASTMGEAGVWRIVRVTAADETHIEVDVSPPAFSTDDLGRSAQACSIPELTDLTVPAGVTVSARAWSRGAGGGVFAALVNGTLLLEGTLSAAGAGYRGATTHGGSPMNSSVTDLETSAQDGGTKGSGLDGRSAALYGRGNWANAAGGGNTHSGGGGGGGNGGAGGSGGKQWYAAGDLAATAGMPGARVGAGFPARLVMGGGGGEGQCHHGGCSGGGSGGGLVLLFARTLAGSGTVDARGASAGPSFGDAGSGGGAGGTIVVVSEFSSFSGTLAAPGGAGANATYRDGPTGPGGGGGGGRIVFEAGSMSGVTPTTDVAGGAAGYDPLTGDPWGAEPGQSGTSDL